MHKWLNLTSVLAFKAKTGNGSLPLSAVAYLITHALYFPLINLNLKLNFVLKPESPSF